jgi:alkylation response protein AidB-like acyl-CoA dehydrogenase
MSEFTQNGPTFGHPYHNDPLLKSLLRRHLGSDVLRSVEADLTRFGDRLQGDVQGFALDAEANPPRLKSFDPWGKRVDEIITAPGWQALDRVSAEEGIVAIGYERQFAEYSRLVQFAKIYLFHPSSAYYTCPLAMSDGAAKLIEVHGDAALRERAFKHLTSRVPEKFWTSGQWMTEKSGGSDVSGSETRARLEDGGYRLYGTKWFTSATTSQMAMTLATVEGSKGLSLFYLELRDEEGALNNIEILRLKDKLGTKALPTAELHLRGARAQLVGEIGAGVRTIATLFNVTRIYNAHTTMGAWKRLMDLARDYAHKRVAFRKPLAHHPLHVKTLADLEVQFQAAFQLTLYTALLLGREECLQDEEAGKLLRLLTPVAKLYAAKRNMAATTELIESFGGVGYIEDSGLPKWLRDNQVLCIWEGTTNVLSLDVLRSLTKENTFPSFQTKVSVLLDRVNRDELTEAVSKVRAALEQLVSYVQSMPYLEAPAVESNARSFAMVLGDVMAAALLIDHAQACGVERFSKIAQRFAASLRLELDSHRSDDYEVLYGQGPGMIPSP